MPNKRSNVDTDTKRDKGDRADTPKRNIKAILIAGVAVSAVLLVIWYINQPVPDEVSLDDAVAGISATNNGDLEVNTSDEAPTAAESQPGSDGIGGTEGAGDTAVTSGQTQDVEGVWVVDTTVGEFSFTEATSSFVGFRIDEELASIGATTAVGRTPHIEGSLAITGTSITETIIEADLTKVVTNASRRDRSVQEALDTGTHPLTTFVLTEEIQLDGIPTQGVTVSVTAIGTLEIMGVTQPIEIPLKAQLSGDLIIVVGSADIVFADWGVELPTSPGVVSIEDHGILEIQLFLTHE